MSKAILSASECYIGLFIVNIFLTKEFVLFSLQLQHLMLLEFFSAHKHHGNILKEHTLNGFICRLVVGSKEQRDRFIQITD